MLHTYLTTSWHLRYPIIGAPMAFIGRGRLAHAVSQAGGLGMIGIGSTESVGFLAQEAAIARGNDLAFIYAGEAVGLVTEQRSAEEVIHHLGEGAEQLLRQRVHQLLEVTGKQNGMSSSE